ncbi:pectate lyase [Marchantia polymorpha subsp. ruderalis]|uniref:Pectate lyase n=1 Tax=Marchantia polymorpha TaxID=3197 RepID=A0A2R6WPJ5_MARPO|nr:hypothetical protein MARPO_0069s0096 [Marchantia polymorpha]BBN03561.1 hypothetical protein Mp_2g24480 [Marchantia polymorpha subsp. ruderalis]|eukprot:PTQ35766.1 hypothetical protein MARPO_0069s0096 [Marchantia polymorpha]
MAHSYNARQQLEFFLLLGIVASFWFITSSHASSTKKAKPSPGLDISKGNPIDDCWYRGQKWLHNRQKLAACGIGFGADAQGGKGGSIYEVTSAEDDPASPKEGTLRHAVTQANPLWIVFQADMTFVLKEELIISSYKTIDARGAQILFNGSWGIVVQSVTHVIIHGIHVTGCQRPPGYFSANYSRMPKRSEFDGDGIKIIDSQHIWVDHCRISYCADGLLDVTVSSNYISVTNNYFEHNRKVMLMGHSPSWVADKQMQATVAFNYFGEGAMERMPRCRYGNFHVVNNYYWEWGVYAIGGSSAPTIFSEGNYFIAGNAKQVTRRMDNSSGNWCSVNDIFLNGAYFISSGEPKNSTAYDLAKSFKALASHRIPKITSHSGPLQLL